MIKRLPGLEWYPAKHWNATKPFVAPPIAIILHSGDRYPGVAEYEATHGGYTTKDGKAIKTCYHIAYSAIRGCLVQQVELDRESWASGGGKWLGHPGRLNAMAISIALPGPWNANRSDVLLADLRNCASKLVAEMPSLRWWIRHSDVDRNKRDPGPGVPESWADGLLMRG